MPKPLDRTGEDEKTIRARLVYQSRKRGMLEGDLLLSTFARDHLGTMSMGRDAGVRQGEFASGYDIFSSLLYDAPGVSPDLSGIETGDRSCIDG